MSETRTDISRRRLKATVEGNGGPTTVAKLANVPVQSLHNYLNGRVAEPPASVMIRIAETCGVVPAWLMALEDHPTGGFAEGDLVPYEAELAAAPTLDGVNRGRWTVRSRALELAGFLPGDVVEFDLAAEPRPGDVVVAQIYLDGAADTVLRIYRPPFLQVHTADPTIDQRPIQIDPTNERNRIAGAFLRMVRERRP